MALYLSHGFSFLMPTFTTIVHHNYIIIINIVDYQFSSCPVPQPPISWSLPNVPVKDLKKTQDESTTRKSSISSLSSNIDEPRTERETMQRGLNYHALSSSYSSSSSSFSWSSYASILDPIYPSWVSCSFINSRRHNCHRPSSSSWSWSSSSFSWSSYASILDPISFLSLLFLH